MKKVVLAGDAIRLQYQERVKELLADVCEVVYPPNNSGYTLSLLWCFERDMDGFGGNGMDLIHWNTGIWDLHRTLDDGEPLVTPGEYLNLNKRLHRRFASYTKNLIWATTTPAGENYRYDPRSVYGVPREQWNKEVEINNMAVSTYLKGEGVAINDLYTLVRENPAYLGEDGVYLSKAGVEAVAGQVAAHIRIVLEQATEDNCTKTVKTDNQKEIKWY